MTHNLSRTKVALLVVGLLLAATCLSVLVLSGCSDTLTGEKKANQKPIVYFVNIPPEGYRFSRNPVIHWVGTDRDGIVVRFRYHVATSDEIGPGGPDAYYAALQDADWVVLDVDPKGPDPKTSNVVSMSADLDDPVGSYVTQYVFVQCFDEQGLASDVKYQFFSRNDNPPQTTIFGFNESQLPFVNSIRPGGIITGVKIRWEGEDPIDYPSDPPPFEFAWELYGPYMPEDTAIIADSFFTEVYVTADGKVYDIGDTIIRCDTFYVNDQFIDSCDTIVVTDNIPTSAYGELQPQFRADDQDFINSPWNKLVDTSWSGTSRWVTATGDTLYDVFRDYESQDTTLLMYFIFRLRARDDAQVADLVPAYRIVPVINPRYERDVAVLDFSSLNLQYNACGRTALKAYFYDAINKWDEACPYDIVFDTVTVTQGPLANRLSSPDYFTVEKFQAPGVPISELLKHKVLIMINDDVITAAFNKYQTIYTAIDGGVNVWASMRSPYLGNGGGGLPELQAVDPPTTDYARYFGVEGMVFTGWFCHVQARDPELSSPCEPDGGLWQDFVGTYAMLPDEWPALSIDPAKLENLYVWESFQEGNYWNPDVPAVPEVNWSERAFGTEVLYLYKSFYGQSHPLGYDFTFQGNPVGHRLGTNLYRTVHFNFSPVCMDSTTMQPVVNRILDWLYDPTLGQLEQSVSEKRYGDGRVRLSVSEAKDNYTRRQEHIQQLLEQENAINLR